MVYHRLFAFALAGLLIGCQPGPLPGDSSSLAIPASSGTLIVGEGSPPVLTLGPKTTVTRAAIDDGSTIYEAVTNAEGMYSIWPQGREVPLEWRLAGKSGPKSEVLAWIEKTWTDMRPISQRKPKPRPSDNLSWGALS